MAIKSDRWIKQMAVEYGMIEPFEDRQVRSGVISASHRTATTFVSLMSSKFLLVRLAS